MKGIIISGLNLILGLGLLAIGWWRHYQGKRKSYDLRRIFVK